MSRSRRSAAASGADPWAEIDAWAADEVETFAPRAPFSARATRRSAGRAFLDVVDDATRATTVVRDAGLVSRRLRPGRGIGMIGTVQFEADEQVLATLTAERIGVRKVERAERFVWRAPMTGPTTCDVSFDGTADRLTIEAWYQPLWSDGLRGRDDPDGPPREPRRVLQAREAVNRLLARVGADPIRA